MNTKYVMVVSAFVLGVTGIALSFLPQEIAAALHFSPSPFAVYVLQILGALYFSYAMLNWTARENLIGGIYGRPIAIGNLSHFVIGALSLIKGAADNPYHPLLWFAAGLYALFAVLFSKIFLTHPSQES